MSAPKTHPLFLAAAASVILASGVGVANWLGFVGKPTEPQAIASVVASAPIASAPILALAPIVEPTPLATAAPVSTPAPTRVPTPKPHPKPKPHPAPVAKSTEEAKPAPIVWPAKEVCKSCGRVISVRTIEKKGEGSGGGAIAGGVLGGVVGHQIGGGNGRTVAEVLGVIGGAVAGHQAEKQYRSVTAYEVRVSFDDDSERTYSFQERPQFSQGDRVRLSGDSIVPTGN
ncbi:MAG: glycine zipper 2TM domain-containing protein [Burkholderiales bacterium]|nr:glycine zipper 2TM domain-containing protein [Burkholderiales bacterium]